MAESKLEDINNYLALYGIKDFKPYELDDDMLKTIQDINQLDIPTFEGVSVPYIRKRTMLRNAYRFYKSKVRVHDVGYMSDETLLYLIRNNNIVSIDQLVELYNSSGATISPFQIPIEYRYDSAFSGTLELQLIVTEDKKFFRELLPKMKVLFNKIILSKKPTELTTTAYIHEIMHSQIESHKGVVANYYDSELFSIFFELLYAYENNSNYQLILSNKLSGIFFNFHNMYLYQTEQFDKLPENYRFYDFCTSGKYLLSSLKAFSLLDKYLKGSYGVKRIILARLQAVMDGLTDTTSFLENFDISYETVLDSSITKRLLNK